MNTYIPVSVYRNTEFGDCTNGGVTANNSANLVVPVPDGYISEEDVLERGYVVLEPIAPAYNGCPPRFRPRGLTHMSMAGGNFVYTSDSRFSREYGGRPVSVHDRVE